MNSEEYTKLALQTESPVTIDMRERACFYLRLQHGVIGLVTESIELQDHVDDVNLCEELGDIEWYTSLILNAAGLSWKGEENDDPFGKNDLPAGDVEEAIKGIVTHAGELADVMKRAVFYGKPLQFDRLVSNIEWIQIFVDCICFYQGFPREDIRKKNIAKLAERYGAGKFDMDDATIRDLIQERAVLIDDNYRKEDEALVLPAPSTRKPLDETYTAYCRLCNVARLHKNNVIGVCTNCYSNNKPKDEHSPVQEC